MRKGTALVIGCILVLIALIYLYSAYEISNGFFNILPNKESNRLISSIYFTRLNTTQETEELLSVYVLARHGARTPYSTSPGIEQANYTLDLVEPYVLASLNFRELDGSEFHNGVALHDRLVNKDKLKGGAGRGRLTKVGEKQLFDLGLRLREKYIKKLSFIANKYDYKEMFVRSTHFLRTIHSAKSFLAGFYGLSPNDSDQNPFFIYLKNYDDENLFPNDKQCKFLKANRNERIKKKLYKIEEYISNLYELYDALGITKDPKHIVKFSYFYDDMTVREVLDLPIPPDIKPLIKKFEKYAAMELAINVFQENPRLTCGPILNEFKEGLINVIKRNLGGKKNGYHKFNYYSNHDSTIMAVLLALGLIDDNSWHWPPFASTITFELWRDHDVQSSSTDYSGYFIRVFYCEKAVELPGCNRSKKDPTKCSMNEFLKILSKYSTTPEEYEAICS